MYIERPTHSPVVKPVIEARVGSVSSRGEGGALLSGDPRAGSPRDTDDADPDIIPALYGNNIGNYL